MSKTSWLEQFNQTLRRLQQTDQPPKVAVVGIGHELNGDDAAGIAIARALQPLGETHDRLLILDAGPAPENQTGVLRRFGPDLVLLVDAAQMNEEPGAVRWLDWQETTGISASTHTLPLYVLSQYLVLEFGCEVALIGIQPLSNQIDAPLSPVVQQAAETVVWGLSESLAPA
jgi:hydrogenase 3 maturation protease